MGTRLYPITTNTDILERIAGVPQGTSAKLEALVEQRAEMSSEAWHNMLDQHVDAERLYDFQLFGFGKLSFRQWQALLEKFGDDAYNGGSTCDDALVTTLLNELDVRWKQRLGLINISDLEGVCWN